MGISFDDNLINKWCVFAWISVALIWKNIILSIILTIFRLTDKQVYIPEDATIFGRQRRITNQSSTHKSNYLVKKDDWSATNRIGKVLENESEYVTYFLIFFLAYIYILEATTTRQIVYGCVFVVARYIHTFGLIFRNSYARIIGFLFSILVLGAITLDLAIILTINVANQN